MTLTCSGDGRETPNKLGWAVAVSARWPSPKANSATVAGPNAEGGAPLPAVVRQTWPTPAARDWKDTGNFTARTPEDRGGKGVPLAHAVKAETSELEVELNPEWVEQLQGLPVGWTRRDGPQGAVPRKRRGKRPA